MNEEAIRIIEKYIRRIRGQDFTSRIQRGVLKMVLDEIKAAQQSVQRTCFPACKTCEYNPCDLADNSDYCPARR